MCQTTIIRCAKPLQSINQHHLSHQTANEVIFPPTIQALVGHLKVQLDYLMTHCQWSHQHPQ